MAETSSGVNCFFSPLYSTSILGRLPGIDLTTLNGQCFMSAWTSASSNLRPMRRYNGDGAGIKRMRRRGGGQCATSHGGFDATSGRQRWLDLGVKDGVVRVHRLRTDKRAGGGGAGWVSKRGCREGRLPAR